MAEAMTNGHMMNNINHQNGASSELSSSSHRNSSSGHSSSKDKHHSSSHSSSKHSSSKHHSSSSSHKHRDGSSKHGSSSSHKHGSSSSSSHKHKDGSSKHRDGHSSSSKHHSSSSKHGSSGSSSKHHSSSSSKHHSSSSKSHSSSSSKHHSSSSSSSSRPKESSSHSKPAEASPEQQPMVAAPMSPEFKEEVVSPIRIKTDPSSPLKMKIKHEKMEESDDDVPLSARFDVKSEPVEESPVKRSYYESDDDDEPLSAKVEKAKKVKSEEKIKKRKADDGDFEPVKKKKKKVKTESKPDVKKEEAPMTKKAKKKKEEEENKWKWWEEKKVDDDIKWTFLEHAGPVLAPPYEPLPSNVRFYYNGKHMRLSEKCEEVATFYGRMLDHDYTTKEVFNRNFLKDWKKMMNKEERETITDLSKCDFREILAHFKEQSELRKALSKEEKLANKKKNEEMVEQYGWCTIDGHRQKIGNFRIEPPGLFRGRGDHPKQGMLKQRTMPEEVIINCSKDSNIPQPPPGHKWKKVQHDRKVTWLACWSENIQNSTKYVMLNAASKLKGEKDWKKYEIARSLHRHADKIRAQYREDWKSKEMRVRQRAVAMYFIDKLALRAGNEKDDDQADTVGCCSLRVEHINLHEKLADKEYVVEFDFLGKDSIRYFNQVAVEKRVFKNLQLFKENKNEGDDLFDRLNTAILNKHLQGLMEGLTAKVFRTYNASKTLQEQLDLLTKPDDPIPQKILSYNRANRAVAILCNHQRAAPKNFNKQMENMQNKIDAKKDAIAEAKRDVKKAKADLKALKTENARKNVERRKKAVERLEDQLTKLEVQATDKDENKEIALGTSKLNYLDPRISVAWCKKWEVPIEKIYNKTQREKFAWAIDMADEDFAF